LNELFQRYIRNNIQISTDSLSKILSNFKPYIAKKNSLLLSGGETCNKLYFVNKGCIRTYYITEKGQEKTRYITFEGSIITSLSSFISQKPSFEFVETLEDSDLLYISRTKFFQLVHDLREWEKFYSRLLEFAYIYQNKKIEELVTLSAPERYAVLMQENPEFIQRLPNKILASYLDITQETLSRLKSK